MKIYKAYKFRLYPTNDQRGFINRTLGCKRFVYNYYLNYLKDNNGINRFDLHKDLPKLKEENEFLKEVDSTVMIYLKLLMIIMLKEKVILNLKVNLVNSHIELVV